MKIKAILLIEDNVAICDAMSELLQLEGYTVMVAHNGQIAIEYLKAQNVALPDMILLDLMMPVMGGVEFLQELRMDENIAHVPVFIMTANGLPLDMEKFNVRGFFRKPVDIDQLFSALQNF